MSTQLEAMRAGLANRVPRGAPEPVAPVLVLGSGKGGSGTSTLAALIALVAAARGSRVLLVDADASLPALHLLLNVPGGPGPGALRGQGLEPHELVVPLTERLSLLPGGDEPLTLTERRTLHRRIADLYPGYDLAVVDGGSRLESVLAACSAGATRLLAVTTEDRISVAATYALIKALRAQTPELPIQTLVNRAEPEAARLTGAEITRAAHNFLRIEIGCAGSVPDDHCLSAGLRAGMSVQEAASGSPAAEAIQTLTILNQLAAARGTGRKPSEEAPR